jgi:hypothetical protein
MGKDDLTDDAITEVKNVKSQGLTKQLKDYLQFAKDTGRDFILKTRADTKLSKPLQQAIKNGEIIHETIPGL